MATNPTAVIAIRVYIETSCINVYGSCTDDEIFSMAVILSVLLRFLADRTGSAIGIILSPSVRLSVTLCILALRFGTVVPACNA